MGSKTLVQVLCLALAVLYSVNAEVPAVFIFGDSTADVGTNNFLPLSKLRADFPHNGIDMPHSKPTGRFSNGLNSADFLAKLFGFKRSPPPYFSSVNNSRILKRPSFRGLNFASGGSGILDLTGQAMLNFMTFREEGANSSKGYMPKNVISLSEQIQQFSSVYKRLVSSNGSEYTKTLFSKSLFFFSVGSNDLFSYYRSGSTIPKEKFLATLEIVYENHIRNILKLGAKKIGIIGIPPVGCCPSQRVYNSTGGCLEGLNQLAIAFHPRIHAIMTKLSKEYSDIKYSIGNAYVMTTNVIQNPGPFGFKEVQTACCGSKRFNGEAFCTINANLCSDRKEYLFWDLFHPTMAASELAANTLYGGQPVFVAPINFQQLAEC